MTDPWLGNYQNVNLEGSDNYLTEHQRETLQGFRAQHSTGFMFHVRQQWENLNERTSLLWQRVRGENNDYESLEPFRAAFRHRRVKQLMIGLLVVLGLFLIFALFSNHQSKAYAGVPKGLQPISSSQDHACDDLSTMEVLPGQRLIQIHNRCGIDVYPGMIGQGGGAVPGPPEGWKFEPGDCRTLKVPSIFPSIRIWGRTGCNNGTNGGDFKCQTGNCVVNGDLSCTSAGSVASLYEATLQGNCQMNNGTPVPGTGPDFYDVSLVDGYNIPMSVRLVGGDDPPGVSQGMSCISPVIKPMVVDDCPFELRRYTDQLAGTDVPQTSIAGVAIETSPCYLHPLDPKCRAKFAGCNSICKAFDEGWIGFYIDNAVAHPLRRDKLDPYVTLFDGTRIRWSEQFLQGKKKCGPDACRLQPAFGGYRQSTYGKGGHNMKDLVCCAGTFFCSPYQPNNSPGCSYAAACPTLGAGDPESKYHSRMNGKDLGYPQTNQNIRFSSKWPDWPIASNQKNYAALYKDVNPSAYSWQYNDGANSLFLCCGPQYIITFCPASL